MGEDSIAKETWKDSGDAKDRDETGAVKKQEVYVLEGGFGKWQQEYVHNPIPPPPQRLWAALATWRLLTACPGRRRAVDGGLRQAALGAGLLD